MKKVIFVFFEAFIASIGVLIFGFISIPLTGYIVGADISFDQGFEMSFIFFAMRFLWYACVRSIFLWRSIQ